jgi:sulfur carrier protein
MRVIVNGEQREIASRSVGALLGELEYEGTHFAIALNFDRDHHAAAGRVR